MTQTFPRILLTRFCYLLVLLVVILGPSALLARGGLSANGNTNRINASETDRFRTEVIRFVRGTAEAHLAGENSSLAEDLDFSGNWYIDVSLYHQGEFKGTGTGSGRRLTVALREATLHALGLNNGQLLSPQVLKETRFLVTFFYPPDQRFSIIEYERSGRELVGDLVPVRLLERRLVRKQVDAAKHYLLRAMHPQWHGFYKQYDVLRDDFGRRLRTVYSASSLFTLLKIYDLDKDPEIEKNIRPITKFILSMQEPGGENAGGFNYSYYLERSEKELRLVVGTASKTIFTLLELYRRFDDAQYINAARRAGDWLLRMQRPNGSVFAYAIFKDQNWQYKKNFSFLYNGQVLSALSRLYQVTREQKYYDGANKLAQLFVRKIKEQGLYLGDEYRPRNSVSTSWITMSLIDFAKIDSKHTYRRFIFQTADKLLQHQSNEASDIYNFGKFYDLTTGGNGWVNEVMVEVYKRCREWKQGGCEKYKNSIILASRWLIQNTYSEENTYHLKSPGKTLGGPIRSYTEEAVRTDAACHGANSLIGLLNITEEGQLMSVPERPFEETINKIRIGKG